MIVEIIDIGGVSILEREDKTPVSGHPDRPLALSLALEFVEPGARKPHVIRTAGDVEPRERPPEFRHVPGVDAGRGAGSVETFEALVAEAEDRA